MAMDPWEDKRPEREPEEPVLLKSIKQIGIVDEQNPSFRRTMEDAHHYEDNYLGEPGCAFFGVYDGHGGRGAVDVVVDKLHVNLKDILAEQQDINVAWKTAYNKTDQDIKDAEVQFSGTTAITALVREVDGQRFLYSANAGDARTVLCHNGDNGRAERLTYDHKGSDPEEQQRIRDAGGFITYDRVNALLAVTRALGDHMMKDYVLSDPYCTTTVLKDSDKLCILACDGIWDVLSDQEVVDFILEKDPKLENAQNVAGALVDKALGGSISSVLDVMMQ